MSSVELPTVRVLFKAGVEQGHVLVVSENQTEDCKNIDNAFAYYILFHPFLEKFLERGDDSELQLILDLNDIGQNWTNMLIDKLQERFNVEVRKAPKKVSVMFSKHAPKNIVHLRGFNTVDSKKPFFYHPYYGAGNSEEVCRELLDELHELLFERKNKEYLSLLLHDSERNKEWCAYLLKNLRPMNENSFI